MHRYKSCPPFIPIHIIAKCEAVSIVISMIGTSTTQLVGNTVFWQYLSQTIQHMCSVKSSKIDTNVL